MKRRKGRSLKKTTTTSSSSSSSSSSFHHSQKIVDDTTSQPLSKSHPSRNHIDYNKQKGVFIPIMTLMMILVVISAIVIGIRSKTNYFHHYQPQRQQLDAGTNNNNNNNNRIMQNDRWKDFDGYASITNQYKVIEQLPHDPTAFTQGLQWDSQSNRMIESTGMNGESQVRIYNPWEASSVIKNVEPNHNSDYPMEQIVDLDKDFFGEGICWFPDPDTNEDRYIQLTWQEQTAFIYNRHLQIVQTIKDYKTTTMEGWGITYNPQEKVFYVSDGSNIIHVWDMQFQEIRKINVTILLDQNRQQHQQQQEQQQQRQNLSLLNELEWDHHDGTIMANVWFQNAIVKIHPRSGQVLHVYDCSQLYPQSQRTPNADVMNGIAHYRHNQWWLTGKYWPYLYLVEL